MAKEDKSKWNVKDFSDADIYDAIRYLEPHPETSPTEDEDQNVVICVCLYIVLLVGLACFWLNR